ncbi:MAG: hypothetical protein ACYC5O_20770 [Anaerolineae bacterium]
MPRTGREPKPTWQAVPSAVRHATEDALGAKVRRALRAWGGYGPTPTYRLRLSDGSGAFFKAVFSKSGEFALAAHRRSDNLRWVGGRLRLFDWPHAGVGPGEADAIEFAQTVTAEGGVEPEQVLAWYGERAPLRAEVVDAHVSAVAAFLACQAWQDDIPSLPRLRSWQRRQLVVSLAWAARRLHLPEPTWLAHLAAGETAHGG